MKTQARAVLVGSIFLVGCVGTAAQLGVINGELTPCPPSPNCVHSQLAAEQHAIQPISFEGTRQEAQVRLLQILASEPRAKIIVTRENYIRVEFTSLLFRFVDDVEFYFLQADIEGGMIHVRSASRLGYSDFGANRKRIERIQRRFYP